MALLKEQRWYAEANGPRITLLAFASIAVVAVVDWIIVPSIGLGFVYLLPMAFAAAFLSRSQIVVLSAICTVFREAFSYLPAGTQRVPRVMFVFLGYTFVNLLVREMIVYSHATTRHHRD